jgi:hypothetical protein
MPYKSQAQQGLFHSPNSPVGPSVVKEFDQATKGAHDLPKHVKHPQGNKHDVKYGEHPTHMKHPVHAQAYAGPNTSNQNMGQVMPTLMPNGMPPGGTPGGSIPGVG